jgi:ABC-type Mn2+/Zn2+ transport system permease subunit
MHSMSIMTIISAWTEADKMFEMFAYPFMQRALITGIFVAVACALLALFWS